MAASPRAPRRQRYVRRPVEGAFALTPLRLSLLRYVADYRLLSLGQLARLACPSMKSARRHLRELFDAGLVAVVPVPRSALAPGGLPGDAGLLFGSAPNLYTLTREGQRALEELGHPAATPPRSYGPRNSLFLAHELLVKDARVWLELAARERPGQELQRWAEGEEAVLPLHPRTPPQAVRPDAWFAYRLGQAVLVGLLEVDRGTERGTRRWREKLVGYEALFASGRLRELTGYVNARVLVTVPEANRREALSVLVARLAPSLQQRCWLTVQATLEGAALTDAAWQRPGLPGLWPLVTPEQAQAAERETVREPGDSGD